MAVMKITPVEKLNNPTSTKQDSVLQQRKRKQN